MKPPRFNDSHNMEAKYNTIAAAVWMIHVRRNVCFQIHCRWTCSSGPTALNGILTRGDRTAQTRAQHSLEHLLLILNSGYDLQTGLKQTTSLSLVMRVVEQTASDSGALCA